MGSIQKAKIFLAAVLMLLGFARPTFAYKPLGTDVSGYQPAKINWVHCKTNGVMFAYVKATEGTGYINSYFYGQSADAIAQGIPVGLYHFARPSLHPNITGSNSADSEAAYFLSVAGPYITGNGSHLIPMLDWEDTGVTNVSTTTLNQTTMSQWVNEWCYYVSNYAKAKGITMKVLVYSGTWYCAPGSSYNGGLNSTVTQWPNAMSGYPTNPDAQTGSPNTSPWSGFTIWQYADTNWSGGDSDVYNGLTNGFYQTMVVAPTITNDLDSVTVPRGSNVNFSLSMRDTGTISFLWYSNQVRIASNTTGSLTISNVDVAAAGNYYAIVSNSIGVGTTAVAYVSVIAPITNAVNSSLLPTGCINLFPCEYTCTDLAGANSYTPHGFFTYGPGKVGRGWKFNGSNTYLTNNAGSRAVPWTFSLWVNRQNAPGTSAGLVSDGTVSLKLEQYNKTRQVGLTVFGVEDDSFGYIAPAGVWTHLVFVGTSTGTSLYANGTLVGSLTNSISLPRKYFGVDYLNSINNELDYMSGTVDEVMVFSRALSSTEISTLYNAGTGALVRVPELVSAALSADASQVQLNLRGLTGKTFTIYRSPDLVNWTSLAHISNPTGTLTYSTATSAGSQNFYQVTQP